MLIFSRVSSSDDDDDDDEDEQAMQGEGEEEVKKYEASTCARIVKISWRDKLHFTNDFDVIKSCMRLECISHNKASERHMESVSARASRMEWKKD